MKKLPIPHSVEEVTPEWLTRALRSRGALKAARVTGVRAETIGVGGGFLGSVARLHLDYDGAAADAPRTLVVKIPPSDGANRTFAEATLAIAREILFYRTFGARLPIRTPRVVYDAFRPRPLARLLRPAARVINRLPYPVLSWIASLALRLGRSSRRPALLLLEDLSGARAGDQVIGCDEREARLALGELAALHASQWNGARIENNHWLAPLGTVSRLFHLFFLRARPEFESRFAALLAPRATEALDWLERRGPEAIERISEPPLTLLHGDCRLDNFMFYEDGRTAIIDWQGPCLGRAAFDVACLVTGMVDGAGQERALVDGYHDELTGRGVEYPRDAFRLDYDLGKLVVLHRLVGALELIDLGEGRGVQLADAWISRMTRLLPDGDLDRLLPQER